MFSVLNYMIFKFLYEEDTNISDYINKLSVRKRNILLRVYVLLGPITFSTTMIFFIFFILYILGKYAYGWVIDIDKDEII